MTIYLKASTEGLSGTIQVSSINKLFIDQNSVSIHYLPTQIPFYDDTIAGTLIHCAVESIHSVTVNTSTTGNTKTRPKNIDLMFCIKA